MNGPSRTAQAVALLRAAHQLADRPLVFDDPLALPLSGRDAALLASQPERCRELVARAFIVMRSRFAEDELARALERGVDQYVLLGAGLDSYAYRAPPSGLRIYEVDRPATLAWKRDRLRELGIGVPALVSYVELDLESASLPEALDRAGFRPERPVFVSLLGVAVFVPSAPLYRVLEFVAAQPGGSGVVLDYASDRADASDGERDDRERAMRAAALLGEPFRTLLDPNELRERLLSMGFTSIDDFGTETANARYFAARADGLCIPKSGRRMLRASRIP